MDLVALAPELAVLTLGALLMGLDMVTGSGSKRRLGWIAVVGLLVPLVLSAFMVAGRPPWNARAVFSGSYAIDPFAGLLKVIVITSALLVLLSTMEFFRGRRTTHEGEVYVLIVFMVLGLALMTAAADLILLFLAIELVSLISYVLAGSLKTDRKSNEAGVKYFFFGSAASAVMLYGFSYLYGAGGTTNIYRLAQKVPTLDPTFAFVAVVLVLAGLGFKISLVPFHQWTPDVYEGAPTPIAAFLSVGSKAAGFAALVRLFYAVLPSQSWVTVLAVLAVLSMTVGNLLALAQSNIKRMLAYSAIAHAGYMMIGVVALAASASPIGSGIGALLYYLLAYTFTNIGAFAVAISAGQALGSDEIPEYAGLSQRAPFSALAMAVFMLSLTGVPPTALFFGKFFLFASAIQSGLLWLAVAGILNSVVSLYYYVGMIRAMYLLPAATDASPLRESGLVRVLLAATVLGTIVLGVVPNPFVQLAQAASALLRL